MAALRARVEPVPEPLLWVDANEQLPSWLHGYLGPGLAEGVAWKFAPLQLFRDAYELSIDNDCILWRIPSAVVDWLDDPRPSALLAEDVRSCFGQFAPICGDEPRNSGLRGLPPGFDLERALRAVLTQRPTLLESELGEQGLQVAALLRACPVHSPTPTGCLPAEYHVRGQGQP